jgi:hypothetical protein
MIIFPPADQRHYPFRFYVEMRRLNPVAYDECHEYSVHEMGSDISSLISVSDFGPFFEVIKSLG